MICTITLMPHFQRLFKETTQIDQNLHAFELIIEEAAKITGYFLGPLWLYGIPKSMTPWKMLKTVSTFVQGTVKNER